MADRLADRVRASGRRGEDEKRRRGEGEKMRKNADPPFEAVADPSRGICGRTMGRRGEIEKRVRQIFNKLISKNI